MGNRLDGKVAIVTGGASGIGEAMARAFDAEGARVVVADVSGGEETVAAGIGNGALALGVDVSDLDQVKAMVDTTLQECGRLDVLCNNAGIDGEISPTGEMTIEGFDRTIAVNVRGVHLGLRYGIPAMLQNGGGSIINTASVAGFTGLPGMGAYCAAKAAVLGMTRVAAIEYAQQNIRVNAICPGVIKTGMLTTMEENDPASYAAVVAPALQMTPMGRVGMPTEIAAAAVFLASDESSFVSGAAFPVDGAYLAV